MWRFREAARAATGTSGSLGLYEAAFLAGGPGRVADTVVIALCERRTLLLRASRVRAADAARRQDVTGHPLERTVLGLCDRSRSTAYVRIAVVRSPEVEAIGQRLAALGLVTSVRHRPTRAGRRRLRAARQDGSLPRYVFEGPAALPAGPVRRGVVDARPVPTGFADSHLHWGRGYEQGRDGDSGSGGGFGCGGGGGD
ncbi:TIGR04222 domain-containing membrane protein [Streptomyces wuyuanensis]|uniref:TIGR04222 domain-containing protein n=1 Tax=Streptomyces wuyuanensis TaxID=1196353 RepID=A0A1G9Z086_9ACTN|nr:TIGR04222 domain-containing membrane protein [Streptomyces wuyuanensis]SDN14395.1 TIGR04222 domain-containing protein [Streptomyces wuyuanensis]